MDDQSNAAELVRLPGFPSCQNSLAWGGDHLAIAAGDTVHILTPVYTSKSSWSIESVRVNRFSEHEWPRQELAAISDLSIGEEQSESKVVALGWSPVGLGLHKRGVLAVLTSNLVLSLWESNGRPGTWRRALVVNKHAQARVQAQVQTGEDDLPDVPDVPDVPDLPGFKRRRSQRIRAFTWLPPLIHAHAPKWGTHILVVADDNSLLTYLDVHRRSAPQDGYEVKTVYQHQLPATELPGASDEISSPLRALLIKEARVSRLVAAGSWQGGLEHDASRIRLTLVRGTEGGPAVHDAFTLRFRPTETGAVVEDHAASPVEAAPKPDDDQSVAAALERAIADSVQQFNEKHHLGGHVRVRSWGSAADPTGTYAAACITLHPTSMLESVDVSKDNILVPLVTTGDGGVQSQADPDPEHAIRRILSWVRAHASDENVKSELDIKLLGITVSLISSAFSQDSELMQWAQEAKARMLRVLTGSDPMQTSNELPTGNGPIQTSSSTTNKLPKHSSSSAPAASSPESCQWCGADIPLSDKLSAARCANSHVFNRCGLTFLAIQEPGISKSCARCGKEFLDMSKLATSAAAAAAAGPSLAAALFEEFYVCPYCHANYSG